MVIVNSYVSLPEGKPLFSYGFPMVFLWFSHFPMVFQRVFLARCSCKRWSWMPGMSWDPRVKCREVCRWRRPGPMFLVKDFMLPKACGNMWKYLEIYGNMWKPYGNIWKYLEIYGNMWKSYGNIWKYMEIYGHIWKYMEIFGNHMEIYGNLWKYMEIFGNIYGNMWKYMEIW